MSLKLDTFSQCKLLVVGDLMLDRYWFGATKRISPEAPVPIVQVGDMLERPGGAGNVALNAAALGAEVTLIGTVGEDEAGVRVKDLLAQTPGISAKLVSVRDCATIVKLRVMSHHQHMVRLDFDSPVPEDASRKLLQEFERLLDAAHVVVFSDYAKGTLVGVEALIAMARAARKPVVVDPKGQNFTRYKGATVITPNLAEYTAEAGSADTTERGIAHARACLRKWGVDNLLLTQGERGMSLISADDVTHLPADARDVYDVTGAGDTVVATFAVALAANYSLDSAAALANRAAGIVVSKLGAATVTIRELNAAMDANANTRGVVDADTLMGFVEQAQRQGERIVMTNGCFDLLHPGHARYLAQARSMGDKLIVAVNSDASVARLKGNKRPVLPLAERMEMLAALKSVDWVVSFDEDTPEKLICRIKPHVLVKGGDYQVHEIAGHQCAEQVYCVEFFDGFSTSALIEKLNRN